MSVLKQRYNQLLDRYKRGVTFLDNPDIPMTQKERWIPEFQFIIKQLNNLIKQIEAVGQKMTDIQILEGFREVKQ